MQKIKNVQNQEFPVAKALKHLRVMTKAWEDPIVTTISRSGQVPFKVLVSTMISLRTKDAVTREASDRLFKLADTPRAMVGLSEKAIQKAIYPAGFYKTKATSILRACRILMDTYGGKVPADMDQLVALPGVGRKTANLVMTHGHGLPGICVDTHVHRISNRWGYVKTRTPDQTEMALRDKLPGRYWIEYNDLLVMFGQNLCKPISPLCSTCRLAPFCPKLGVTKSR